MELNLMENIEELAEIREKISEISGLKSPESSDTAEQSDTELPDIESVDLGETLGGIYVQLSRLYDVMMLLALNADPAAAQAMAENHAKGVLHSPPPVIAEYGEF
jgi:hypothetical protein